MEHVVTKPTPPFLTADGALEVHQLPAWRDNLIWLAVCTKTREAAAVDGPEARTVLDYCAANDLVLTTILNTHTHMDHVGINHELAKLGKLEGLRVFGPARKASDVPGLTDPVDEGATASVGEVRFDVLLTEGHIDGHVSYVHDDVLFCGTRSSPPAAAALRRAAREDAREPREAHGPPALHAGLLRARVHAGQPPLRVERRAGQRGARGAGPRHLGARAGRVLAASTIGLELATNPFVRPASPTLRARVAAAWSGRALEDPVAILAATRELKDRKDYASIEDADLPI
ncbi:MAG: hydroxyacylglutathione hydrolase C-terminal domain-containing protein [Sandaracinaceae bacterium]